MFLSDKLNKGGGLSSPDARFNYVTMLLHGDGTNGTQNNTFLDSSANNLTITRNGSVSQGSFSPYGSNWSNYFGIDDSINRTLSISPSGLSAMTTWTIECFTYSTPASWSDQALLGPWGPNLIRTSVDNLEVYLAGAQRFGVANGLPKNQWNHLAICCDSSGLRLYVNGTRIGNSTGLPNLSISLANIVIGAEQTTSTTNDRWNGYISNFRVLNGTALYTGTTYTVPTTALTAITNTVLLTCQGNRFVDASSNNWSITVNGTPSVQRFNPFGVSTTYSTSILGGSVSIPANQYLSAPSNTTGLQLNSSDFTIEFWLYSHGQDTDHLIGFENVGSTNRSYGFYVNGNNLRYYLAADSGLFALHKVAGTVYPYTWNHVALTRSGSSFYSFVNGKLGETATSTEALKTISSLFTVGSSGNTIQRFVADLRVIKGTCLYTSAFTPPTAPLTAVTNTQLLLKAVNASIFDNTMMNDLETVGNVQISTSVKKYGTGSLAFDGNGDYLAGPYNPNLDFGTGDFTVELWFYFNGSVTGAGFIGSKNIDGMDFAFTSSSLRIGRINTAWDSTFAWTPSANTWYHIAFTRSNGTVRAFVDGTQVGSSLSNTNNYYPNGGVYVGVSAPPDRYANGYIDDLRITKGYARYTTTFTPPTKALSDTGPI